MPQGCILDHAREVTAPLSDRHMPTARSGLSSGCSSSSFAHGALMVGENFHLCFGAVESALPFVAANPVIVSATAMLVMLRMSRFMISSLPTNALVSRMMHCSRDSRALSARDRTIHEQHLTKYGNHSRSGSLPLLR